MLSGKIINIFPDFRCAHGRKCVIYKREGSAPLESQLLKMKEDTVNC